MGERITVRYLPPDLHRRLGHALREAPPSIAFDITRIVESAYAQGYDEGHLRGGYDALLEERRDERQRAREDSDTAATSSPQPRI
ncbi:hypothetical protein [Prauserella endophytica]|uniref:Toxin-antitoxin system HicB family antitoxin n=1 Tax=Prauserella endophytica TaxID=1592324 RepID=A0ABY2RZZ0_9PSEU|nr:hypothetical protein [Prauserella endophytica]PXY20347.1 hypothetical protein BAY59_31410 [Prauserella coralliicola]TKG66949.1 hypothetical protein FCN18_23855 [Prauserella endophytica]